jgi:glycosyltransferase involved in cell wall biosynthesis
MASLSIVVPVYNERDDDLRQTLDRVSDEVIDSSWERPEIVIVDDGSEPPVQMPVGRAVPTRVVRRPNGGRFEARRTGIAAAEGEYVLLLDSRTTLEPGGMAWVAKRVEAGDRVWNGHCMMANLSSPYARFWNVMTHSAFADYLDNPRTTSFGIEEYDRYPKGTTHFLAPRAWLMDAISSFDSYYEDTRNSNDDTQMLRALAARDRIHISPQFASLYRNREALRPFLSHAVHRGTVFFDGFGRRGTRFFPVVIASLPTSVVAVAVGLRHPWLGLRAALGLSGAGALLALRRRRPLTEALSFGLLVAPFSVAFSAGIWHGAWLALRDRLRS